jgi:uncharacterized surface protein with fasciclin (FAS1) repeats
MNTRIASLSALLLSLPFVAHAYDYGDKEAKTKKPTITAIAAGDEQFSTLVTALKAAGLAETLNGEGPFTVFAPTNAAFEKLPEGTLEQLLADKEALTEVLLYHVAPGKLKSSQVVSRATIGTVQGSPIAVNQNYGVSLNDAGLVKADVYARNGVIHVIDSVLLPSQAPKAEQSIAEVAAGTDSLSTLVSLLQDTDLVGALAGDGSLTVFAPTNEAFGKLPKEKLAYLANNPEKLKQVLLYHVVAGEMPSHKLGGQKRVATLQGSAISLESGSPVLSSDNHVLLDVPATNGVIHVIDTVLLPPDLEMGAATSPEPEKSYGAAY